MVRRMVLTVPLLLSAGLLCGQQTSDATINTHEFAQHVNSLYYRPVEEGLDRFTCRVHFDWDTVPRQILLPAEMAGRKPLSDTRFLVTVYADGHVTTRQQYAAGTPAWTKPAYDQFFGLLGNFVTGFLQTWAAKALNGPLPAGRFLTGTDKTDNGYRVTAADNAAHYTIKLSPTENITEVLTDGATQSIDEHTVFTLSPQGWVLTDDDATNQSGEDTTRVRYQLTYQMTDGFRLPNSVELKVNENIDMKFSLTGCEARKGTTVHVAPPVQTQTVEPR